MVNLEQAVNMMVKYIKQEAKGQITIYTFKKDRWISIHKINEDLYEFIEHGFKNEILNMGSLEEVKKQLKKAVRLEFPRSHSAHIKKGEF